jgi:benzoyl-CoA reductase subunit A
MKCVVGIDLGSTTTKAVLLAEDGSTLGRGITNSRSNYEVASAAARQEAHAAARFRLLSDALAQELAGQAGGATAAASKLKEELPEAFRLEAYLEELGELRKAIGGAMVALPADTRSRYQAVVEIVLDDAERLAPEMFGPGKPRKSDFFRDLAAEAFVQSAERRCTQAGLPFERVLGVFDRAILEIERRLHAWDFGRLIRQAAQRIEGTSQTLDSATASALRRIVDRLSGEELEEVAFVGTGYGRQTLPFPKEAVRSEILCHGRGAHRVFPGTRTVLDIGGQDTKAIQVDDRGVVTSFQMNDRCAAGCGRYLGYIADELNLGLHELGPLALGAKKTVRVNSTCTVFAGAELKERLSLGERREDILAGLHRAIMLRAMSLLARSGGVSNELTFTGGVCKNPMATKVLAQLVLESYGDKIQLNIHPDSIYMGALGAALFALDDFRAGAATVPQKIRDLYERTADPVRAAPGAIGVERRLG